MNPADNYLFYSSSGCNFSLIPPKPKIPVLTVRREMYPFRFNDNVPSKTLCGVPIGSRQNERAGLEVEIQFVREGDKSTVNTIRRRAAVDLRLSLADLPTQLLSEIGCIIDPSLAQVEVFGLRLLDWSCLIPLDVVSEDLSGCTVGDKLSVLLNFLLFFFRVSIKSCHDTNSVEVWSIIGDLVKRFTSQGAYHRLKQMNCPLLKTNSNAVYEFLFQGGSVNLDSLDQTFQLSFLDIFSFDNWYRSFPINQFLNGVKSLSPGGMFVHNTVPSTSTFEQITTSLSDALRKNGSFEMGATDGGDKSCTSAIQEAIFKLKGEPHAFSLAAKAGPIDPQETGSVGNSFSARKPSSNSGTSVASEHVRGLETNQKQTVNESKLEKRKVRNRVTFVVEDLKQLDDWFKENPRPSREKFQAYAAELNRRHQSCHSKAKRTLHARNIVYWFKNARAAYKRMSGLGGLQDDLDCHEGSRLLDCDLPPTSDRPQIVSAADRDKEAPMEECEDGQEPPVADVTPAEDSEGSVENVFLHQDPDSATEANGSTSGCSEVAGEPVAAVEAPHRVCRRRARIFLDPASEVLRLEHWFQGERYPDLAQIEAFTGLLNASPYRQNHFRKLVPENVTLWFKNRRARLKRSSSVTTAKADQE